MPGIKNLSGIEILVKYVRARARIVRAKNAEITYSL